MMITESFMETKTWEACDRIRSLARVFKQHEHNIMIAGGFARDIALDREPTDIDIYMFTPTVKEETFLTAFLHAAFDNVDEVVEKSAEKPGYVNQLIYKVYGVTFTDPDVLPLDIIFLSRNPFNLADMDLLDKGARIKDHVLPFECNMSNAYMDHCGSVYVEEDFLRGALQKVLNFSGIMTDQYKDKMKSKFPDWEVKDI